MGAFFSTTDDRDDINNVGFSGVVGKINDAIPEVKMRFNYYKQKYEVNLNDLFEAPPVVPELAIPEEWLSRVHTPKYLASATKAITGVGTGKGSKHDHLAPYRFRKGEPVTPNTEVNGNRAGPGLRNQQGIVEEPFDMEDYQLGKHWGVPGNLAKSPLIDSPVEKNESINGHSRMLSKADLADIDSPPSSVSDDHYSLLAINNGPRVADAYVSIMDSMGDLSGNSDLIEEVIGDLFSMSEGRDQLGLLKHLYSQLSRPDQEKLATSGF